MDNLLYDALMLGRNKEVAREEYLAATGEKLPAKFRAVENEIVLTGRTDEIAGVVHLELVVPGYLEIECYCESEIINFEKKVITTDEFTDGTFEFGFTADGAALHSGKNFARIEFRTVRDTESVCVCIDNRIRAGLDSPREKKRIAALTRDYLDLRCGGLFQEEWQEKTGELLLEVNGSDAEDIFLLLYRANLFVSEGKNDAAREIVNFAGQQLAKTDGENPDLSSYYFYVRTRLTQDEAEMQYYREKIRSFYREQPSWRVLWALFYTDETYDKNPAKKLEAIKAESELRGCTSPVMYYEAAELYRRDNTLIKDASGFEMQVLYFCEKSDLLTGSMALQIAGLLWDMSDDELGKRNIKLAIRLLEKMYARTRSMLVLKTLCRLLIADGRKDRIYNRYFEEAIENFLETPEIYYFDLATSDKSAPKDMHESVIEHFLGRESELRECRDFFLASLITYKEKNLQYYKEYSGSISKFAREKAAAAENNRFLAVIYKDVFEGGLRVPELSGRMLEILRTCEVTVDNDRITEVLVFHRELNGYQEAARKDGKFYVRIFSDDSLMVFKDQAGNLYADIDCVTEELLNDDEMVSQCISDSPITKYMLLGKTLPVFKSVRDPEEILNYLLGRMGSGQLRSYYEQQLLEDLIRYFTENAKYEEVYERLLHFMEFDLEPEVRGRLIEVMIEEHLYKEAYEEIKKNGTTGISINGISRLAHVLVEFSDNNGEELLNTLCMKAFEGAAFDPVVFRYLCTHYDGDVKDLLIIYQAAKEKEADTLAVSGKIIEHSLDEDKLPENFFEIFDHYYNDGEDEELKEKVLNDLAAKFLYHRDPQAAAVFEYIKKEARKGTQLSDATLAAFIVYMQDKQTTDQGLLKYIERAIYAFERRDIMLGGFKEYDRYFKLPARLANTCIAESYVQKEHPAGEDRIKKNNVTEDVPVITFNIYTKNECIHGCEAMMEIIPGCYVKYFELFFGETAEYSIEGGETFTPGYNGEKIVHDGSRYSDIDEMLKMLHYDEKNELKGAAEAYYKKSRLIEELF